MGCDIHMFTEVKVDGAWHRAPDAKLKCYSCGGAGKYGEQHRAELRGTACHFCNGEGTYATHEYWDGRNYDLFAMLAGVRNGRGFAGVKTGAGFNPISKARGLPKDLSAGLMRIALRDSLDLTEEESDDAPWMGDHSFSWLLLSELESYDWTQTTTLDGVIPARDVDETYPSEQRTTYKEFRKTRQEPKSWCGDIAGPNVVTLNPEEYESLDRAGKHQAGVRYYVRVTWKVTYQEAAGSAWSDETMPLLRALAAKHGGPENVRLVFGFDS